MKILKYALGIFAILALIFFAVGIFKPSVSYSNEVTVDKSLKESWAVFQDESKLQDWLTGFKSTEVIEGERNTVGAKSKVIMMEGEKEMEMIETITVMKKEEQMGMDFEMEGIFQDYDMHFSEKDGKTIIRTTTEAKGEGMIMRSIMPFIKGTMTKQDLLFLTNLKNLIEKNTTDYFSVPVTEGVNMEAMTDKE